MANEEIFLNIDTVRSRLEQLDKESQELTELVLKLKHIKESLVSFQAVVEKNSHEAEQRLQEVERKWSNSLKEFENINLRFEETQKVFEESSKNKPEADTKRPGGLLWAGVVIALLLTTLSIGIQLWDIYGTSVLSIFKIP